MLTYINARRPLSSNIFLSNQGGLVGEDHEVKEGEDPAKGSKVQMGN